MPEIPGTCGSVHSSYQGDQNQEDYDEDDTFSLLSQSTSTMTIGDSLPAQLVRRTAKKGFTFNIMSVGPNDFGKTTLLSALFGRSLEAMRDFSPTKKDKLNPPVTVTSRSFEIEERRVRLKLTVTKSEDYGDALCLKDTYLPLVNYIDDQFADYYKRESSFDRRNICDKMIHCLFFFISPFAPGLSKLDIEFLKCVANRVNVIPIIAKAEGLTISERTTLKWRIREDLKKNSIQVYRMSDPDSDDPDDLKRVIKDIQDAMPFAVSSVTLTPENTLTPRFLGWGQIDPFNPDHSDYLLLKTMLNMQIPDLCEITHEKYYEEFRLEKEREFSANPPKETINRKN